MKTTFHNAMLGSLIADAVAMPVHWYYNTNALDCDYGQISEYVAPKNPHADSILWRSKYKARNERGDILREQAKFWGQRGVHYHQFLRAGENTINYKLGVDLYELIVQRGCYQSEVWLDRYVSRMLEDGWHKDTYVEEYHRAFFDHYSRGKAPQECSIDDIHIGGLSQVPCLIAALDRVGISSLESKKQLVETHVRLTHRNRQVAEASVALCEILSALSSGSDLRRAISEHADKWVSAEQLDTWCAFPDRSVVGRHLSSACYLPESFTASLYLAWKYADNFSAGILANAHCGGDNCHRGAVVGSLLAAANGISEKWITGLQASEQIDRMELPPHGAGSFHDPEHHHTLMDRVDTMLKDK